MDFESAVDLSPLVEKTYAGVVVVGARRMSFSRADSWALEGVGWEPYPHHHFFRVDVGEAAPATRLARDRLAASLWPRPSLLM